MPAKCCIRGCENMRKDAALHSFPVRNEVELKMWLVCLEGLVRGVSGLSIEDLSKLWVCNLHFQKRCISKSKIRTRLISGAYPSLFLPEEIATGLPACSFEIKKKHISIAPQDHNYSGKKHCDHNYCKIFKSCNIQDKIGEDYQHYGKDDIENNHKLLNKDSQILKDKDGPRFVEDKGKKESKERSKRNYFAQDANMYGIKPTTVHRRTRCPQSPLPLAGDEPVVYDGIQEVPQGYTAEPELEFDMCRICLTPSSRLLSLESYGLSGAYEQLTGVTLEHDDGLPRELCVECATLLDKYHKFRDRSIRGDQLLRKIHNEDEYEPKEPLEEIENKINELASKLDYSAEMTFIDIDPEIHDTREQECQTYNYTSDMDLDMSVVDTEADGPLTAMSADVVNYRDELVNMDVVNIMNELDNVDDINDIDDEVSIKEEEIDFDAEITNDPLCSDEIKTTKDDNLLRQHFTVIHLNNIQDQMSFHQEKGGSSSYLFSNHKCCMCFEGFSNIANYKSHVEVHSKERGHIACVICKWRFNQVNDLKLHAEKKHFYKYHCLKCEETIYNRKDALRHMKIHILDTS